MRSNIDAFNDYVKQAKEHYATLTMSQDWEADSWAAKGDLAFENGKKSLHFAKIKKTQHQPKAIIENRNYIDFCKAQAVNSMALGTRFGGLKCSITYMKHMHRALLQVKGTAAPWSIDDAVFEQLESNLLASNFKAMKGILDACLKVVKPLKVKGVISVGITFTNTHEVPLSKELKELQQRRKKASSIDDNERDGDDKLISMKAMHSLAWLTYNAIGEWEQVAIRYYHILIVTGFRIGELLRLRNDALVSVAEVNENTGKPILVKKLDENGKPVLDESGKPELEPQLIWGIEYHPEKGHVAAYKWLDKTSAQLVIAAFEFINKQTIACRAQLKHLELHPAEPIHWADETISYRDVNQHFFHTGINTTNSGHIYVFKIKFKKAGVLPVKEIVDTDRMKLRREGIKGPISRQPVYRVADLNRYYHRTKGKHYSSSISLWVGDKGKRKNVITIKKSELLCITPQGVLGDISQANTAISYIYPDVMTQTTLGAFFGSANKRTPDSCASVFNRYGLKEEDGSNIYIQSHLPRHQLNTFLALADVNEHQQALIVGRRDITQNRDYQHLSLKDKTRNQDTSTASMRQRVNNAQQPNEVVAESPEPNDSLLAELGVTPMGPTPTKLAVQQSVHAFNKPAEHVEFMQEALAENNLLGELQGTFNAIRKKDGLQSAKEFVEVHGRNFHIVVNGSCTRNLALHGCDKQLRCLDGEGCFHLTITGRPGELDSIRATHQNLSLNVEKMSRLEQAGKLKSRRERDAFEKEKHNLSQMGIVLGKAENFSGFIPLRVFNTTMRLNQTGPKKTVVESFAQDQRELREEK